MLQIPFHVISPGCDWDTVNGQYFPYHTLPPPKNVTEAEKYVFPTPYEEFNTDLGVGGIWLGGDPLTYTQKELNKKP